MSYRNGNLIDATAAPRFWTPPVNADDHWVYLHLSAEGECLYVGRTKNAAARCKGHESNSDWWARVANLVWFGPMTQMNAGQVEREFIKAIDPPYNVKHTSRDVHHTAAPDARRHAIVSRIARLEEQLDYAERQLLALDEDEATA